MSTASHMRPAAIAAGIAWACIAAPAAAQSWMEGRSCEREIEHRGTVELAVGSNFGQDTFGPFEDFTLRIHTLDVRLRGGTLLGAEVSLQTVKTRKPWPLDVSGAQARVPSSLENRLYADRGSSATLTLLRPDPVHVIDTADYTLRGCLLPRGTAVIERPVLDVPGERPRVLTPREPVELRAAPRPRPVGNR